MTRDEEERPQSNTMKGYNAGTHFGLFLTRAALGGYLILAGWGKVVNEVKEGIGFFASSDIYKESVPDWLPWWFSQPYGFALPWVELLIGGLIVLGLLTRIASLAGFMMLTSFIIAMALKHDTWTAQPAGPGGPFSANYIQAAAYLLLVFTGAGALSIDRLLFGRKIESGE